MGFNIPEQVLPWTSTGLKRYGKHWSLPWEARTMPVRAPDGAPAGFCRLFEKYLCAAISGLRWPWEHYRRKIPINATLGPAGKESYEARVSMNTKTDSEILIIM